MKTLLLTQGDLVVTPRGHATVSGSSRVKQDLALALGEELGNDRYHREWGSVVARFVGGPITASTELAVISEVNRVLGVYIGAQRQNIQRDALRQQISRFSTSDVVQSVKAIDVKVNLDTITVSVLLETGNKETVSITRTVGL